MPDYIDSDEIRTGRNAENNVPRDSRYIRCSRCGWMCNTDRDIRAPYGSKTGEGVTREQVVQYDGAPDTTPVEYDGEDEDGRRVTYDGHRSDFTITGGCPFCGSYTFDKEEYGS